MARSHRSGTTRSRPRLAARATVAAVAGAVLVLLAPGSAGGDTFRIKAAGSNGDFSWRPSSKTVVKGSKIVWKNPTGSRHTVTAYSNNWSKNVTIGPGERTSKKFRKPGRYKFRCMVKGHSTIHDGGHCAGMCGVIKVTR